MKISSGIDKDYKPPLNKDFNKDHQDESTSDFNKVLKSICDECLQEFTYVADGLGNLIKKCACDEKQVQ